MGVWLKRVAIGGGVLFAGLFALGVIAALIGAEPSTNTPDDTAPAAVRPSFSPDPRGIVLAKLFMLDDFSGYMAGKRVVGDWSQIQPIDERVTAERLHAAYEDNEVAADETYKGKTIAVTGKVIRTAKDAFGSPYVLIEGGGMFDDVQASLADETIGKADLLVPGQRLLLICKGNGMMLTFAELKDCQADAVLVALKKPNIDNIVDNVLRGDGEAVPDKLKFLTGYSYVIGVALPAGSPCETASIDEPSCRRAVHALDKARLRADYDKLATEINLPPRGPIGARR